MSALVSTARAQNLSNIHSEPCLQEDEAHEAVLVGEQMCVQGAGYVCCDSFIHSALLHCVLVLRRAAQLASRKNHGALHAL